MSTSLIPFNNAMRSHEQQIQSLQQELFTRNRQLAEAEDALRVERQRTGQIESGVHELRTALNPLYQALQHVFGEFDAMGTPETSSADPRKKAIWDSWKQKLPSGEGRAIDALLLHGSMTTAQLRIHVGCASRTAQNIVAALKGKGLIVKDGAQIKLKEL